MKPILRSHCFGCHGEGKGKPRGNVDLTSIANMGKTPGLLTPGKPEKSDFYTSITSGSMPGEGKPPPSKEEMLVLKNWILTGAKE